MRCHGAADNPRCYHHHPKEVVVGICALCLKERLLVLASEQNGLPLWSVAIRCLISWILRCFMRFVPLFYLVSFSYLLLLASAPARKLRLTSSIIAISSFILKATTRESIPQEQKIPPVWHCHCHGNGSEQHSGAKLRWRKRIGHLLQLARWKRSNKASTSHVGFGCKVDGVLGNQQEFR
ncbi:hypothetical protein BHE74_00045476 [Ensete ventricosum]|nr:hypothetical protein BHE74_00045476 [Ensete ventricosum]